MKVKLATSLFVEHMLRGTKDSRIPLQSSRAYFGITAKNWMPVIFQQRIVLQS